MVPELFGKGEEETNERNDHTAAEPQAQDEQVRSSYFLFSFCLPSMLCFPSSCLYCCADVSEHELNGFGNMVRIC